MSTPFEEAVIMIDDLLRVYRIYSEALAEIAHGPCGVGADPENASKVVRSMMKTAQDALSQKSSIYNGHKTELARELESRD